MFLKKGDILIKEGDRSNQLYWLMKGQLGVYSNVQGLEAHLNTIEPGELVGELAFLDQKPRSATVKALEESQLLVLEYSEFQEMLKAQPKWMKKLLITLTSKVRKLSTL
jgi:CRP/FNR family cyclic AMP-dependent transcriptional regulator